MGVEIVVNSYRNKIAVLLATYNGEKYVEDQIRSILSQKNVELKIFIHDDFSTDTTMEILKSFSSKFPEKIKIMNSPTNLGVVKSFQYLMDNVEADFYFFSDQDDVWDEYKVDKELNKIAHKENVPAMVYSDLVITDAHLNVLSNSMFKKMNVNNTDQVNKLIVQNVITGNTVGFNRKLRDLIVYNFRMDNQAVRMHDGWIGLIATIFGDLEFINTPTVKYRQHLDNVVGAKKVGFLLRIFTISEMKKSLLLMIDQAHLLEKKIANYSGDFNRDGYEIVLNYSKILDKSGLERWKTLSKFHIGKQGVLRNLAFLMLILTIKREKHV